MDYELNLKKTVTVDEQKIFNKIRKGDLIMNTFYLNESESDEYLYYDTIYEVISMALRVCTEEKLNKIEKYTHLYFEDQELVKSFDINL